VRLYLDCDDYEAVSNRFAGAWQQRIVRWWEDRLPRLVRAITVNTAFLAQRCQGLGVPAHRIVLIPNGYDPERFASVPPHQTAAARARWGLTDKPMILYLGSFSLANHPVLLLLDAMPLVRARLPGARLCLAGGGDDFDRVRAEVEARGLGEAVVMTGRVEAAAAPALYTAADVVVDPVHADDTARARSPLKLVEALACGVPVVTGDVGDRAAMLGGGQAGVLVRPGDAAALADSLLSVLESPDRRARLVAGARVLAPAFAWDKLARDWAQVYAG